MITKSKNKEMQLVHAALNWQAAVVEGCRAGAKYPNNYLELNYEHLVNNPSQALEELSEFIGIELTEEQTNKVKFGSLEVANSIAMSSTEASKGGITNVGVGRWKNTLTSNELKLVTAAIAGTLKTLGYVDIDKNTCNIFEMINIAFIKNKLKLKDWLRSKTILGRLSKGELLYIKDASSNKKATSYDE